MIHCDSCGRRNCPECGPGHDRDTLGTIEADDTTPDEDEDFTECPNCGNTEEGTAILECTVCGLKHCDDCSEKGAFLPTAGCPTPDCAGTRRTLGHIARKVVKDDDKTRDDEASPSEGDDREESDSSSSSSSWSADSSSGGYTGSYGSSNSSSSGLGKFLLVVLAGGVFVLFLSSQNNREEIQPYRPQPPPPPPPPPALSSDGRELMILRGTWPAGATSTKTIAIPDPRNPTRTVIDNPLQLGDDLELVLEPLWMINFETVGKTIEVAIDEGDGFISLTQLQQAHDLIPREQGRPWLLKRRIIRFHRTNESGAWIAPLRFGIEKLPESRATKGR